MTKGQTTILHAINKYGDQSSNQIADTIGRPKPSVRRDLLKMCQKGDIIRSSHINMMGHPEFLYRVTAGG